MISLSLRFVFSPVSSVYQIKLTDCEFIFLIVDQVEDTDIFLSIEQLSLKK